MGPRLFSRGKTGARARDHSGRIPSMGPRLFSRGKLECRKSRRFRHRPPFNGAPAIQPGKGTSGPSHSPFVVAFNGAPAIQPGKGLDGERGILH